MEADVSSSLKKILHNRIPIKNKPKRIRKLIPGACKYCNKRFADSRHLYAHIRIHTGEKPYVCEVCQRAFNQRSNFRRHLAIHNPTERKLFYCDICEKQYLNKQYYKEHMTAHDGLKPYSCDICSRTFAYRSSLQRHVPKHEANKKKYVCDICQEGFEYLHLYHYHMRIHNPEEKPYACIMCKKAFSKNYHFYEHLRNIHNIKTAYQCKTCNECFPNRRKLEIHYLNDKDNKCSKAAQEEIETTNELEECFQEDIEENSDVSNEHLPGQKTLVKHTLGAEENENSEVSQDELQNTNESMQCSESDTTKNNDLSEGFINLPEEHTIKTEPKENFESGATKKQYFSEIPNAPQMECEEIEVEINSAVEQDINSGITKTRYFCGICYEEIDNNTNMQEHLHTHTQQPTFVCFNCKLSFDSRSLFAQHACSNDTVTELFECYICEKSFSFKEELKKHLFTHTEEDSV